MSKAKGLMPAKKVQPKSAVFAEAKESDDNYEIARLNREGNRLLNNIRQPPSPWYNTDAAKLEFDQNKRLYERIMKDSPVAEIVETPEIVAANTVNNSYYNPKTNDGRTDNFTVVSSRRRRGRNTNRVVPISGGTRKKRGGKWSKKYKKSINCKRPKGFSQKQYCKYGRKKKGGRSDPDYSNMSEQELLELIANQNDPTPNNLYLLKEIIQAKNTFDTTGEELIGTTKTGFMALKKINKLLNNFLDRHHYIDSDNELWTEELDNDHRIYANLEDVADAIISDSSPEDPIEGVVYNDVDGNPLYGLDFHEQFQI